MRGTSMAYMKLLTKEHEQRLPCIRIKKVELTNFKGVKHGVLEFNCAREKVPYNTKSDIMGIYGQNGSGKSSLVDALMLIRGLMSGFRLSPDSYRFIDVESDNAHLSVVFDFQYKDGTQADVEYSVRLSKQKSIDHAPDTDGNSNDSNFHICVSDERISTHLYADGARKRWHSIVDTGAYVFCKDAVVKECFTQYPVSLKEDLTYLKRKSFDDGRSFVFNPQMVEVWTKYGKDSKYKEILTELSLFAGYFLHVIGSRSSGLAQLGVGIPLYLRGMKRPIVLVENKPLPAAFENPIKRAFDEINTVIGTIIPDLKLDVRFSPATTAEGDPGICTSIFSVRGDRRFPFTYESDGIVKIVYILADFIVAFNQCSTTLVVDEFDSGIYEYLLGELLQIFEESGKGQFIFTSHNLRPLEVIDKKFVRFTTYDPYNRYYRLTNVGETNNLRDLYLRKIQLGNDDVEIYRRTKSFKIVKALRTAGGGHSV